MGDETLGDREIPIALVGFVDVDYFITINVHAQPLDLRYQWRLVQKRVSQSLVDKRGKTLLPA